MATFLSGIGKALRAPGFGDRLQAALAAAGGDTNAILRLRALQMQQAELQRRNDARDAQVIGAKNMGFSNDEIGAMSGEDLSWAARQRIAAPMFDPAGGESYDVELTLPTDAAPLPAPGSFELPGKMRGTVGPKMMNDAVERRFPYKRALALFGRVAAPGFGGPRSIDRNAAVQWAAAAIQRGADPKAVRARLNQVGLGGTDLAPQDPFSDLIPGGRQEALDGYMAGHLGAARQGFYPAVVRRQDGSTPAFGAPTFTDQMQTTNPTSKPAAEAKSLLASASFQPDDAQEDPFTHMMAADERGAVQPDRPRSAMSRRDPYSEANLTLGPNEQYRAEILAAARTYGLTPQGLAATIGAEMLPGRWNPNAESDAHAVGLMQFLPNTWIGEGQRHGSFLNRIARDLGYLDRQGHIDPAHREQFLALRNNPRYSIWAGADYASQNLNALKRDGYVLNPSPAALARYAYLAHHEGLGGSRSFLRGAVNIDEGQFRQNMTRPADRARYLAANGNDRNRAYRDFHSDFVDRNVDVTRYMLDRDGVQVPPTRTLFR